MSRLKSCFETLGYSNVSTYINSGNVIFESSNEDFSNIEPTLRETFGFEIRVVVRSGENIVSLAERIPSEWVNDDTQKTDILFLWDEYDRAENIDLIKRNPEVDRLVYIDSAIVWNISRSEYTGSKMEDFIGTNLYKHMTARNVNTVRKLAELMK